MAYTTINKSTDYFNTVTWTGDNGTSRSITGVGHQPDWTWIKHRNGSSGHHVYDSARGVEKRIRTDTNAAQTDVTNGLTAFGTDGFTVGNNSAVNGSGNTFVAWNWKANGAGSANTAGTINSTVSVNTTAGFSIVKWTGNGVAGASIGHGLGVVPKLIIVKRLNDTANWTVYHASLGNTHRVELNETGASTSDAGAWNNQTPTTTLFYTGNNLTVGNNGSDYIAYCFAEKTGYSKFGSYTGNGNADGTFVYTGFKPSFVMIKEVSSSGYQWTIVDNKRSTDNSSSMKWLFPDNSGAETTESTWDLLSNCLLYTSPSPRDRQKSRMPSSA